MGFDPMPDLPPPALSHARGRLFTDGSLGVHSNHGHMVGLMSKGQKSRCFRTAAQGVLTYSQSSFLKLRGS